MRGGGGPGPGQRRFTGSSKAGQGGIAPRCKGDGHVGTLADMQRAMRGFHQDGQGHWVAELECGHTQHVRHQPPFTLRPWVMTPEGRAGRLGQSLECAACDRREMPAGYAPYKRTAQFTEATVPAGLLHDHQTKAGVWALLHVTSGALEFLEREGGAEVAQRISAGQRATIRPGVAHRVMLREDGEFYVEFWRASAAP